MIEILKEHKEFLKKLEKRAVVDTGAYYKTVHEICGNVKEKGDKALFEYTKKFDKWEINTKNIKIAKNDLKKAFDSLKKDMKDVLLRSKERIWKYQSNEMQKSWISTGEDGEILGTKITPIEIVGLYVPGGKASYPSSVLMNAVPAKVAGVKKLIMCTPMQEGKENKMVLAAAYIAGVDEVYKIGGAQAIAAMAYGTKSIPKVDKIVGPGNIYVAMAKKEVFGSVGIDSIAGPSEILIVADKNALPNRVAADLLSQAEHDELASGILITDSMTLAKNVQKEIKKFYNILNRKSILDNSLKEYCKILMVKDINSGIELANKIAPEHLELALSDPFDHLAKVKNAGAIFLGYYTPEALGDYMAGPDHVLPTNRTARFFSPLSVNDFIKRSSIISFQKESFMKLADDVIKFAMSEGLDAHALSIKERVKK